MKAASSEIVDCGLIKLGKARDSIRQYVGRSVGQSVCNAFDFSECSG